MWITLALLAAAGHALSEMWIKQAIHLGCNGRAVMFIRALVAAALLAPVLLLGVPNLGAAFWTIHLVWVPLEVVAMVLSARALSVSPLSLTVPFISFTPLFLVIVEGVVLGKWVSGVGVVGILLIVVGSYVLNVNPRTQHWLDPLRAITREQGSWLMLIVAAAFAGTSLCASELVALSTPLYYSWHLMAMQVIGLAPFVAVYATRRTPFRWHWSLAAAGAAFAGMAVVQMTAFDLAFEEGRVAYVIAIKRVSGIFAVLLGWFAFKERVLGDGRVFGATLMTAGAAVVAIAG